MGIYHGVQLALALGVVALVAWRLRVLCFVTAWKAAPFMRAVREYPDTAHGLVADLASVAPDTYISKATCAAVESEAESKVILSEIAFEAFSGLDALRTLARVGTASGLLGMVGYLVWMVNGDHGLVGLQAGLAETIAWERAILAMTIGVSVALFAHSSRASLSEIAKRSVFDARRATRAVAGGNATAVSDDRRMVQKNHR